MRPILDNLNLTLLTETLVTRLVIECGRVTGAEVRDAAGETRVLGADQTVLAGGALASPAVLLRSGIGPADELTALGIDVTADVPGVGKNLQDHFLVPVIFGTSKRDVAPPTPFGPVTQVHWFWKSDPALAVPDTQPINFSVPFYYDAEMTGPPSGFTLHSGLIRPQSTGSLSISSIDPAAEPVIDFNLFEDPADLAALVASTRQCREVGRQSPLADEWGAYEVLPGEGDNGADDSDEAIAAWVRRAVNTYHHQVGTCKMGVGDDAVVDPLLNAHAVTGLMIADASIMPTVTTGNTNAPTALIAERAADILLGR